MKGFTSLGRLLSKPASLWAIFALVIALAAGGLTMLSRQALRLSEQQRASQARDRLNQNIRVALWRLDSRLGPYIATLHDPSARSVLSPTLDDFVLQRFAIRRDSDGTGDTFAFSRVSSIPGFVAGSPIPGRPDNWNRLNDTVSVDAVVSDVEDLLPRARNDFDQALVQSYSQQILDDPFAQQGELDSRNAIVQQQVALNNSYSAAKGGKSSGSIPTIDAATLDQSTESSTGSGVDDGPVPESNDNPKLMTTWVADNLIVVRSSNDDAAELDGVWIDWPRLQDSLVQEIEDLVPGIQIRPVPQTQTIDPSRTLAAIPAMLVSPITMPIANDWSPTDTSLLLAWCALLVATCVAGFALNRLIALSERRASFVSAVTHEMRTPLTTFRLYSDLLARNMVTDSTDRQEYLETLRREADRLTHLVDNVLRYSKLQRTSKPTALEPVVLSQWLDRITPRLQSRLSAADMTLVVDQRDDGDWNTDPLAMEQVLFNLVDNAAKYAQDANDRRVHLRVSIAGADVVLSVTDHGQGVPKELRTTIFRPFTKSAQRAAETSAGVGLGLALAREIARALGGELSYHQAQAGGAQFRLRIPRRV